MRLQTADCPRQQIACFHAQEDTRRHMHTHRSTHTFSRSRLGRLSVLLLPRPPPSTCLPAPLPCRTRLVDAISGELALARSKFRRTQSPTYLIVDLRLPPTVHIPPRRPKPRLPAANPPLCAPSQNDSMRDLRISPLRSFKE